VHRLTAGAHKNAFVWLSDDQRYAAASHLNRAFGAEEQAGPEVQMLRI